ncbi:nucleolar protein 15 [Blastomyces parvus]|uniref:Nucleolar protein 15 n=1 Tax=Blastomyces parvus TaxID=2060905 RepID=A0A2B7WZV8_9EURO|nr:nucleolar protein 15 [Blastomyces parvus]
MAVEKKDKKRKAAIASAQTTADPPSKKSKKSTSKPVKAQEDAPKPILKKPKAAEATNGDLPKSGPVKVTSEPAREIRPRKRAADFLSDDEAEGGDREKSKKKPVASSPAAAKSTSAEAEKLSKKKSKKAAEVTEPSVPSAAKKSATKADSGKESSSTSKSTKKSKDATEPSKEISRQIAEDESEGSEGEQDDDQTAALIQGFESSGDEDISGDEGFEPGKGVPAIPDAKQMKRKLRKMKKNTMEAEEPGTVYVGRVPHGFYEHEMRAYFSQFGPITQLRLSRNRTTGRSKHFAFIEFASDSIARVVADTMDNYLMFGHILKCKYVPKERVHPQLWKGANKRFKRMPWNAIERRRMDAGKTREQWSKKIELEEARRAARAEKMKALGYEFEMPALKGVDEVPVAVAGQGEQGAIDGVEKEASADKQEQPAAIEAPTKGLDKPNGDVADAETTPKKAKKEKQKKKDTPPAKETKRADAVEKKKEGKSTPKKEKVVTDTPEKPAKDGKGKASPAAAASGKSEKKGEKSKGKKSKA